MSSTQSLASDDQRPISTIDQQLTADRIQLPHRDETKRIDRMLPNSPRVRTTWTERLKSYFLTNDGRIAVADLLFTVICVVLQHVMGTCHHVVSDGQKNIKWHVFTPPFGAGPHTAVFFLVLSWTVLAYCLERVWVYLTTGARVSKKRDLIVHGVIVVLFFTALGFNIWGYVLCESGSQLNASKAFVPGVCRGDSQTCIPLIAGVLASCAAACAFLAEHILALTNVLRARRNFDDPISTRIVP